MTKIMTTQIKFRLLVLLALLFIGGNSFSQSSNVKNLQFPVKNISQGKMYSKVLTQFETLFPNAENVNFYDLRKDIGATFKINDLRYRVLFNKKGRMVYKVTHGKEKHLPTDIRKLVKREYVEFIINDASLVEEAGRKIWVINLEDDSEYVIARFENDELNENMKFQKQK